MLLRGFPGGRCAGKSTFVLQAGNVAASSARLFSVGKSHPGCGGSAFPEDNFQVTHLFINVLEELGGSAVNVILSSSLSFLPDTVSG